MPLWKIYHPVGAFSLEDKKGLSEAITALYARGLPKFYVGVVFQEVAADSFFIGGESVDSVGGTTYGGTGVYGAQIGGVWDAMLGESDPVTGPSKHLTGD